MYSVSLIKEYKFKLPIRLTELQRLIYLGVGKGID